MACAPLKKARETRKYKKMFENMGYANFQSKSMEVFVDFP